MRNFIITVEGKRYEVGVEEVGAAPSFPGGTKAVPLAAPAAPVAAPAAAPAPAVAPAPAAPVATSGAKLLSPFNGLVKGFLVEEGAQVKKDQPVLVLEAMKMDSDITAPCDGVISFKVAKGANVETDALLAVVG